LSQPARFRILAALPKLRASLAAGGVDTDVLATAPVVAATPFAGSHAVNQPMDDIFAGYAFLPGEYAALESAAAALGQALSSTASSLKALLASGTDAAAAASPPAPAAAAAAAAAAVDALAAAAAARRGTATWLGLNEAYDDLLQARGRACDLLAYLVVRVHVWQAGLPCGHAVQHA
jgi:hypothetical protein